MQHPHTESNGDHEGRSPMLYPLSYAGKAGAGRVELPSPESESGALTVMRSACNIVTEIPRARIKDPGYAQNGRVSTPFRSVQSRHPPDVVNRSRQVSLARVGNQGFPTMVSLPRHKIPGRIERPPAGLQPAALAF